MARHPWSLSILALAFVGMLVLLGVFMRQEAGASPAPQTQFALGYWSYAAKFVCGLQRDLGAQQEGEPPVKPANYATEINIHNPNYKLGLQNYLPIHKKLVVLVRDGEAIGREPRTVEPTHFVTVKLGADFGTMDDCNAIWRMLYPTIPPATPSPIPNPMPLTIGHLVIISQLELDIDAVYTAAVYTQTAGAARQPAGISIDVERVTGRRITLNTGVVPTDGVLDPQELIEDQQR